jgi:hypothetical protein
VEKGGVLVVPLGTVGALDPSLVGLEIRRPLGACVLVGQIPESTFGHLDEVERRPLDLEGVALPSVSVSPVELSNFALERARSKPFGGQEVARADRSRGRTFGR